MFNVLDTILFMKHRSFNLEDTENDCRRQDYAEGGDPVRRV